MDTVHELHNNKQVAFVPRFFLVLWKNKNWEETRKHTKSRNMYENCYLFISSNAKAMNDCIFACTQDMDVALMSLA